jgi:hypothetical protein
MKMATPSRSPTRPHAQLVVGYKHYQKRALIHSRCSKYSFKSFSRLSCRELKIKKSSRGKFAGLDYLHIVQYISCSRPKFKPAYRSLRPWHLIELNLTKQIVALLQRRFESGNQVGVAGIILKAHVSIIRYFHDKFCHYQQFVQQLALGLFCGAQHLLALIPSNCYSNDNCENRADSLHPRSSTFSWPIPKYQHHQGSKQERTRRRERNQQKGARFNSNLIRKHSMHRASNQAAILPIFTNRVYGVTT